MRTDREWQSRRIEPGRGATQTHLALATLLAGVHHGIVNRIDPGPPHEGNAGEAFDPGLPMRLRRAWNCFGFEGHAGLPGADYAPLCRLVGSECDEFDWLIRRRNMTGIYRRTEP